MVASTGTSAAAPRSWYAGQIMVRRRGSLVLSSGARSLNEPHGVRLPVSLANHYQSGFTHTHPRRQAASSLASFPPATHTQTTSHRKGGGAGSHARVYFVGVFRLVRHNTRVWSLVLAPHDQPDGNEIQREETQQCGSGTRAPRHPLRARRLQDWEEQRWLMTVPCSRTRERTAR